MSELPFDFAVENYPLAPQTLYEVGGPARLALLPRNRAEVEAAYAWMRTQDGPKLVLGGGSNVLVSDKGFDGIVIFTNALDRIEEVGEDRYVVEGGAVLDTLVQEVLLANNYAGTGGLTGIPGTVGGAIYMNAGTVKGSICELLESVDLVSETGPVSVAIEPASYSYRGQTFCPPRGLIVAGHFRFTRAEDDQRAIYDHYIQRRKENQPQGRCCGSVFKNPENEHAGRLIEACGLKGTRQGDAVISSLHANFVMNEGKARCSDILALIALAKESVRERFGIELEEEVRVIGA
jgi:UDP-N-acetylmuramate dehydrogenase